MKIDKPKQLPIPKGSKPSVGDSIYIRSAFYIDRGEDDICGGKATISKVYVGVSAGESTWFIEVKEIPENSYNYSMLLNDQERLKKEYDEQVAYPCPDYG